MVKFDAHYWQKPFIRKWNTGAGIWKEQQLRKFSLTNDIALKLWRSDVTGKQEDGRDIAEFEESGKKILVYKITMRIFIEKSEGS